ncbi:MAG: DUF3181 family protein [Leptolyngbyaceae bacterium]|nr:DUF3181 family protein [Leptolyngbyaceae bacterium]
MSNTAIGKTIQSLATEIGENIYIDVANWHLFLKEAHLHTTLAEHLYPLLENDTLDESDVQSVLGQLSVKMGGGKCELPLSDLVPSAGISDLVGILEEAKRDL